MKRGVVLDKSFLQGMSREEVHALARSHRLVMPGALFYELLTTTPAARRMCFSKLPQIDNPVILVEHIGILMAHEIHNRRPVGQPSGHRLPYRFRFNRRLLSEDYELPQDGLESLRSQTHQVDRDVQQLIELSEQTDSLFPGLLSGSAEHQSRAHRRAEALVGKLDEVRRFYARLESPDPALPYPPITAKLGKWAHLRWLQVLMLFAMDLHVRYRGRLRDHLSPKVLVRLEHDVHDAQVLALASLEGGLATNEGKLLRWWSILRPDVSAYCHSTK